MRLVDASPVQREQLAQQPDLRGRAVTEVAVAVELAPVHRAGDPAAILAGLDQAGHEPHLRSGLGWLGPNGGERPRPRLALELSVGLVGHQGQLDGQRRLTIPSGIVSGGQQRLEREVPGGWTWGLARDGRRPRRVGAALDSGNEQRRGVLAGVTGVAAALGAPDLEHRSMTREVDRRRVELPVPAVHDSEQGVLLLDPRLLDDCLTPHVSECRFVTVGPDHVLEGTRIHFARLDAHAGRLAAATDISGSHAGPPCRGSGRTTAAPGQLAGSVGPWVPMDATPARQ